MIFSVAAVSAPHHREGLAGQLSVPGLAPRAHRPSAGRSPQARSAQRLHLGQRADGEGSFVDCLSRRARAARPAISVRSRAGACIRQCRPACRSCPISVAGSRHVMRKGRLMTCPGEVELTIHEPIPTVAAAEPNIREVRALADAGPRHHPARRRGRGGAGRLSIRQTPLIAETSAITAWPPRPAGRATAPGPGSTSPRYAPPRSPR